MTIVSWSMAVSSHGTEAETESLYLIYKHGTKMKNGTGF